MVWIWILVLVNYNNPVMTRKIIFISVALYTIQIVLKQLHHNKYENNRVSVAKFISCEINSVLPVKQLYISHYSDQFSSRFVLIR